MAWAMSIDDPERKIPAIRNTFRRWSRQDYDAANVALEHAGLSDEQLQSIRRN
jgi:hypothetical protein